VNNLVEIILFFSCSPIRLGEGGLIKTPETARLLLLKTNREILSYPVSRISNMPHTSEFIERMKALLVQDKERLERELSDIGTKDPSQKEHYEASYPESGGNSDDDNAMEVTEYSDELSLKGRLEKELHDTNSALKAIEKEKYGICKYCGKEIDEKRLEARPASSSCIACKKALTQEI
jgi:RNA polymerase-binding protein DksA